MTYLPQRKQAYSHPRYVLDGAQSIVMLGLSYFSDSLSVPEPTVPPPGFGQVARYARGSMDYHDLIHQKFRTLIRSLRLEHPSLQARGVVDTAPLPERDFARLAGLGWVGKNTMLINRHMGSYFFLAALLVDQALDYDPPHLTDHCGTCTRCLDACPTAAFVGQSDQVPGVLDATRCISFLTIEHDGPIDVSLRAGVGQWWFGCDICQQVCPWNRHSLATTQPELLPNPDHNPIDLVALFGLSDEAFRGRFRKTAMWRTRRSGALRNAAIVLGNQKLASAVPVLVRGLSHESDPVVRGAIAWALGEINTAAALTALTRQATQESDPTVQIEIENAIAAARR